MDTSPLFFRFVAVYGGRKTADLTPAGQARHANAALIYIFSEIRIYPPAWFLLRASRLCRVMTGRDFPSTPSESIALQAQGLSL
jgi:hypothetical protein